jgi:hypothetical protein
MAKHTPGPWVVGPIIALENISITSENGESVIGTAKNLEIYAATYRNLRPLAAECEANARLIAAAPDLLAACIDALEVEEKMAQCPDSELAARLRAAIAKATD